LIAWHYHDDDLPGDAASVTIDLTGVPAGAPRVTQRLIDEGHSNSFTAWLAMGSPQSPTEAQIRELEDASRMNPIRDGVKVSREGDSCRIAFGLNRQGVSLIELEWKP